MLIRMAQHKHGRIPTLRMTLPIPSLHTMIWLIAILGAGPAAYAQVNPGTRLDVGRFEFGQPPWQEVAIKPELKPNRFEVTEWHGVPALKVQSDASMSLMARSISVDLRATPVLCWRWWVDRTVQKADINLKAGDDYAARVYVALKIPAEHQSFSARSLTALARSIWGPQIPDAALNYVWDNRSPQGTVRANAYTDRATMVVQRSGSADIGRWVWERRNIAQDIAKWVSPHASIAQLAVTADTDNTGESVTAAFADLHFTGAGEPCPAR